MKMALILITLASVGMTSFASANMIQDATCKILLVEQNNSNGIDYKKMASILKTELPKKDMKLILSQQISQD